MEQVISALHGVQAQIYKWKVSYRVYLDKSMPLVKERWIGEGILCGGFLLRVVLAHGWYVQCYALAIFLLNMFLGFLSPKFTPDLADDLASDDQEAGILPTANAGLKKDSDEEFKPFVRRVPEFDFWLMSVYGTVFAILNTLTRSLDIPVFWPILVIYFFVLLFLTMRRQIEHMIKYRYVPFDFGKKRFGRS